MKGTTNRKWRLFAICASVGLGLLLGGGRSAAQGMGAGGSGGGMGGSSFGSAGSGGGSSSFGGAGFGGASSFGGAGFGGSSSFGGAGFSGSSAFGSNNSFGSSAFGNSGSTFSSFSGGGGASRFNTNANSGFPTVGTTNAFATYYLNPMAQGLVGGPTGSSQNEFGMPLYGTTALATATTTTVSPTTVTFAPSGSPLLAPYVFAMTPAPAPGGAAVSMNATPLLGELRQILDRSSALALVRNNIQVGSAGGVIVLRGRVNDEHERRIAEGLMRLTPGVHEVRNELVVPTTTLPPPIRSGG